MANNIRVRFGMMPESLNPAFYATGVSLDFRPSRAKCDAMMRLLESAIGFLWWWDKTTWWKRAWHWKILVEAWGNFRRLVQEAEDER